MDINVTLHLWSLHVPENLQGQYRAMLSPDETDRMDRFVYDNHRLAYLAARGGMRRILGAEMGFHPKSLNFDYGPQGKPALAKGPYFNLSHAGHYACLAIHPTCPLGVDIEAYRTVENSLAQRFFSTSENAVLNELPSADKEAGFFRCWTRKEAVIKAIGGGLSIPLNAFDVTLTPDVPPRLTRLDAAFGDAADWCIANINFGSEMAGAVAAQTKGAALKLHIASSPDNLDVYV